MRGPLVVLILAAAGGMAQCSGAGRSTSLATTEPSASGAVGDPLTLVYDRDSFAHRGKLLARIRSSPFAYYRYLGGPFNRLVCERYRLKIDAMPTVSLHGDAHLEQYAVADDGFGVVDFDDATLGPPVLDWLRFATSVWLATANERGAAQAIKRFVEGYRLGLRDPEATLRAREPGAATRIRQGFNTTPGEWLDQVSALIEPLDESSAARLNLARDSYLTEIRPKNPELPSWFFELKRSGALRLGVGSAHQTKFLVRVEGRTRDPADDVILEKKQMKHELVGPCARGDVSDPVRVIAAQARFSRSAQRLLGYAHVAGETFYVHAWRVHYTEIRVEDVRDATELGELAYDFGLQLGRGHPLLPHDSEQGKAERRSIDVLINDFEDELEAVSSELAVRVRRSYEQFRTASDPQKESR